MSLFLARCPGNEMIVVMAFPFVMGALALLSLVTSILLFQPSWRGRIAGLTKVMIGIYAISVVFGAAIVLTNDPSDNGDWFWLVAAIPLIPVFQGQVCRYLSKVRLGMQSLPEEKPRSLSRERAVPWLPTRVQGSRISDRAVS